MSSDSPISKSPLWDWPYWMKGSMPNPLDVFAAPQNLVQPILPGWTFGNVYNVTEQNSGAPDTERDIVAQRSYGRQLGWVIDAVAALIENQPAAKKAKAFQQFLQLRDDIEGFKTEAAKLRLNRFASDLTTLKQENPDEFEKVAARLREVLSPSTSNSTLNGEKPPKATESSSQ